MNKCPYIIIGMHRSGTSILAKILEKAGIFMGVVKDHNYEAIHFLSLNQQTMYAAGSDWLNPSVPDKKYWKYIPAKEIHREHFRLNTLQQKLLNKIKKPRWGWKDPRNTFTLPMWLHLFPNAKVIHLYRDGNEVAKSLQSRNKIKGEVYDERLDDLNFNLELHRKYVDQARTYKEQLGKNYLEINYGDLLKGDAETLNRLESFCKVNLRKLLNKYLR